MNTHALAGLTLDDVLPHRGDMMLISEVLEVDGKHALTLCSVQKSWPMADEKGVHPLILVELAAQTAGVCNGWDRIQTKGLDSEKTGWLVGIKKAHFAIDSLPYGASIVSRAENTHNFGNLREVTCELHMDQQHIGTITLQLFQESTE